MTGHTGGAGWALGHRKSAVIGMVVLFVASLVSAVLVGAEFSRHGPGVYNREHKLPRGTVLEETERVAGRGEQMVAAVPEMEDVFVVLGSGSCGKLVDLNKRKRSSFEIADYHLRQQVADIAGAEISVESGHGRFFHRRRAG